MKKTVLITGATGGIGMALAEAFFEAGYKLALHYYRNEQCAERLKDIYGDEAVIIKADISVRAEVDSMIEQAVCKLGHIDVLINNAGIAQFKQFQDITEEDWDRMFGVDVKGVFNCTQAVIGSMLERKSGRIINVSSVWGISGASCESHYSAAKAAVIGLTKALAKELGPSGITVNCIAPGVIETRMNAALSDSEINMLKEETPLGQIGRPSDIAEAALYLAGSGGNFVTGQVISPNGGFLI